MKCSEATPDPVHLGLKRFDRHVDEAVYGSGTRQSDGSRALDPSAGPVQKFAAELRKARAEAGSPKYLAMARSTGRSRTALAEAAGGDHLATWETVAAYLTACGQRPADWFERWERVRAQVERDRAPASGPVGSVVEAVHDQPQRVRLGTGRALWFVAGAMAALAAIVTAAVVVAGGGRTRAAAERGQQRRSPRRRPSPRPVR